MKHSGSIILLRKDNTITSYRKKYGNMSKGFFRTHVECCRNFNKHVKTNNWTRFEIYPLRALKDISSHLSKKSQAHLRLLDFFTNNHQFKDYLFAIINNLKTKNLEFELSEDNIRHLQCFATLFTEQQRASLKLSGSDYDKIAYNEHTLKAFNDLMGITDFDLGLSRKPYIVREKNKSKQSPTSVFASTQHQVFQTHQQDHASASTSSSSSILGKRKDRRTLIRKQLTI